MNKPKRLAVAALLAASMAVGLAGCGGGYKVNGDAEPISTRDVALLDKDGDTALMYGKRWDAVERDLGISGEERELDMNRTRVDYGYTTVYYAGPEDWESVFYSFSDVARELSTIEQIVTTNPEVSTPRGISVGDPVEEVLEAYGMPLDVLGDDPCDEEELEWTMEDDNAVIQYKGTEDDMDVVVGFRKKDGKITEINMSVFD